MDNNIITECYVDTCLVETLVPATKGYNHQKGCNNVAKIMQEKLQNEFALGIVDKDKRSLQYLEKFDLCKQFDDQLYLYKHRERPHYIIQIAPAVETFIMNATQASGSQLSDYRLPDTLKELISETKVVKSKKR